MEGSEVTGQNLGGRARPGIPGPEVLEVEAQAEALLTSLYLLHLPPRIPAPPPFGLQTHPGLSAPDFHLSAQQALFAGLTDMLIPGPRKRWPGRPAEGTEG